MTQGTAEPVEAQGCLQIVATPIGNLGDVSQRLRETLERADVIAAEDTRHTRRLLSHLGIKGRLVSCHEHNEARRIPEIVEMLRQGHNVALVTDAGTPGISDPGGRLVAAVYDAGGTVQAIPGPSAVIAALSVAGVSARTFTFLGFLPRKGRGRTDLLEEIRVSRHAVVLYESPQRIVQTLRTLGELTGPRTVAVCRELTKRFEQVVRGTADEVADALGQEPRGEITVVIEGAAGVTLEVPDVETLRAEGKTDSQIAAAMARATGRPRSEIYRELTLEKKKGEES